VEKNRKFDASYLAFLSPDKERVAELPPNRYLPQRTVPITEHLIQLLWRNSLYNKNGLRTTNGLPVKVLKPGRLNSSSGPDFKNAAIVIGNRTIIGDVEIHINSEEWFRHNHHVSRHYNKTILHVFLNCGNDSSPATTRSGRVIPELELGLYLRHPLEELRVEVEESDRPVTGRAHSPPCRKMFLKNGMKSVYGQLDKIGDGRMLIKSNRIMERLEESTADQVLYEIFFECLGYSRFKEQFGKMAHYVSHDKLQRIIKLNGRKESGLAVQGTFFMVSGLEDSANRTSEDSELKELLTSFDSMDYNGLERLFGTQDWNLGGCRPVNYPHRRVAAFSRLISGEFSADYYRGVINSLRPAKNGGGSSRKFVRRLLTGFSELSDSFWDSRYTFNSRSRLPKKLIGRDRGISLIVDGLIPFFLAISRTESQTELEHKLAAIYLLTPKPSSNAVVDFMERHLFGRLQPTIIKSVRHQQALIQLYNDFCYMAPGGCNDCQFLEYLQAPTEVPVQRC